MKWAIAVAFILANGPAASATPQSDGPPHLLALIQVNMPNYTGGLTRADRAIAQAIYNSMEARYRARCDDPPPLAGVMVRAPNNKKNAHASLKGVDPDLAFLIRALDNPRQEVRDLAAYTIGLLGPDAKAAVPILTARFNDENAKGGWYNSALERVSCERIVEADFTRTIPDELLPPGAHIKSWNVDDKKTEAIVNNFYAVTAMLLPRLYLDPDIEYPPGTLSREYESYWQGKDTDPPAPQVPLLAQIVDDTGLSLQKRIEAASALAEMPSRELQRVVPTLIRQSKTSEGELRFVAGSALIRMGHEKGIAFLIERIGEGGIFPGWEQALCAYGPAAIAAEDKLMRIAQQSGSPSFGRAAIASLGCIRSTKAVPMLISLLDGPDWQLAGFSAISLGEIRDTRPEVTAALTSLMQTHWSKIVKNTAMAALGQLAGKASQPASARQQEVERPERSFLGLVGAFDHGMPKCGDKTEFSIDGKTWFDAKWQLPQRMAVPRGFPKTSLLQPVGSQTFLKVEDGWLVGSDGFEGEGVLAHVSEAGIVHHLDLGGVMLRAPNQGGDATVRNIVRQGQVYLAFGYQILTVGEAGVLWQISRAADNSWMAQRTLILPSAPMGYARAPDGQLVLRDGLNTYAVVDNRIVPLQCRKSVPNR